MASDGSTGFRHWIILSILLGEDGSGWAVPDGIGDGTTGVRVVYEKPDEEEVLASAQLLFSGLLSFLRIARKGVLKWGSPHDFRVRRPLSPSSNELGFTGTKPFQIS